VHFGLGSEDAVKSIEVLWPGESRQALQDIKADRFLKAAVTLGTGYSTSKLR
jgi:hypothetical protein